MKINLIQNNYYLLPEVKDDPNQYALGFVLGAALALYLGISSLDGLDNLFSLDDLGFSLSDLWDELVQFF